MTELEKRSAAKIPGADTGIKVKHSYCSICAPGFHCGVDAYIKDGVIIKTEGSKGHPMNDGLLCTKGCSNRSFVYRPDRLRTPLKRVGARGEGKFVPISWEEAYDLIASNLLNIKTRSGANAVAFYSGYQKWYRFMLERFAYSFGSINFGTESSSCFTASRMGWLTMTGVSGKPDIKNAKLFLAWGAGNHHSRHLPARAMEALVERGGKLIVIDPRNTPMAMRKAALHLKVKPGTDGLLASCLAGLIIRAGKQDQPYIDRYIHGYEEYARYVCSLDIAEVSRITTVPEADIRRAAEMICSIRPMSIEANPASIIHQSNGYQTVRSIFALSAITGNYDTVGGNQPSTLSFCEQDAGFSTRQEEFEEELTPAGYENRVGAQRFPLWGALVHQMQAVTLPDQICEEKPYPIRALFALGLNYRIFPNPNHFLEALKKLDFVVDTDLFLTDSARWADVVLPACSSFEHADTKVYPGGFVKYYQPVIEPLYQSRSDAQILQDLAIRMDLPDPLLRAGYRSCISNVFGPLDADVQRSIEEPLPVRVAALTAYKPLAYLQGGCKTPSGKLELYSNVIAACGRETGLQPLPIWEENKTQPDPEYPFLLLAGVRIPNAIHSQLHNTPWPRSLRPDPMADISVEDAETLNLQQGDSIQLYNRYGCITVKANPTVMVEPGQVYMYHGYSEADVNDLIASDDLDPYSGFPGFKSGSCAIRKI